jgi:hypothetical protein
MDEVVLETEAIEVPADGDEALADEPAVRPLPVKPERAEVTAWTPEVRTAALAAAGGIVAGAATVAVVRATAGRSASPRRRGRRGLRRDQSVIASRSFLVDVHLLGSK